MPKKGDGMDIEVRLVKTTKPKFMHNATGAGKLPVWTFQWKDKNSKQAAQWTITMTRNMPKDERQAKTKMAEAAKADVLREYPGAEVTVIASSMAKDD